MDNTTGIIPSIETISSLQAAEILGVSRNTVLLWYRQGRLPGYQLGGHSSPVRLYRADVLAFLKAQQETSPAHRKQSEP